MRAVAYCRVSTDEQDQLNSLQNQKEHYQELFKTEGFSPVKLGMLFRKNGKEETREYIDGIFADEGITGTKLKNREAFKYMLECAKKKEFDIIYVKNVARFARCVEDGTKTLKDLKEYGIKVIFEDGNLNSFEHEMVINLFFTVAQEESRNKSVAVQFGVQKAQKKGKWNSQVPYGYKIVDGYLQINDSEIEVVKNIFNLYLNDGWGTGKIVRYLNNNNIPTKKGKQWSQTQIGSILDNCIYTGKQVNHTYQTMDVNRNLKRKIPPEEWNIMQREELRIIANEEFEKIQAERQNRREMLEEGYRTSNEHLLSNILYCYCCGSGMKRKKRHTYSRKDGTSKDIGYEWSCQRNDMYGKSKCAYRNAITEELAIQLIKDEIKAMQRDATKFNDTFEKYINNNYDMTNIEERKSILSEKIERLKKKSSVNLDLLTDRIITKEQYKQQNDDLQAEIIDKESELNKLIYIKQGIEKAYREYDDFMKELIFIDTENLTNQILKKLIHKAYVSDIKFAESKKELYSATYEFIKGQPDADLKKNPDYFIKEIYGKNKSSLLINWRIMDSSIISINVTESKK